MMHWLGLFHPILIHFPIVLLILLFLSDLVATFTKKSVFSLFLITAGTLSLYLAIATGLMRSEDFVWDHVIENHRNLALGTTALATLYLLLKCLPKCPQALFLILSFLIAIGIGLTGDLGGLISHSETPFAKRGEKWPPVTILDNPPDIKKYTPEQLNRYLKESIQPNNMLPLFIRNRCIECHQDRFVKPDLSGFYKTIDNVQWVGKDFSSSELYRKAILKNDMPPKNVVNPHKGLSAPDRLILLEWLTKI